MNDLAKAIKTPSKQPKSTATVHEKGKRRFPKWLLYGLAVTSLFLIVSQFWQADSRGTFEKTGDSYKFIPNANTKKAWVAEFDSEFGKFVPGHENFIPISGTAPYSPNNKPRLAETTDEERKETAFLEAKKDLYSDWLHMYDYQFPSVIPNVVPSGWVEPDW